MENTFDLHMHTTASDGSDTIPQLLEKLRAAGIDTFSVTDHDTVEGALEMKKLVPPDMKFFLGIEFSCISPQGKCHILGYNYDPDHPDFRGAIEEGRRLRAEKLRKRLDFLEQTFGIRLTDSEMAWLLARNSPGKPHLGKILVNRGMAPDLSTAINTYISPCPGGDPRITADMAIKAILASGGIPVWAHPLGGEGERHLTEPEFTAQLAELKSSGIRGLECFYSRYTREEIAFLRRHAQGLLVSSGSDYHGLNKKNIHLGKLNCDSLPIDREQVTILKELP